MPVIPAPTSQSRRMERLGPAWAIHLDPVSKTKPGVVVHACSTWSVKKIWSPKSKEKKKKKKKRLERWLSS